MSILGKLHDLGKASKLIDKRRKKRVSIPDVKLSKNKLRKLKRYGKK